jgi:CBS domain-containing protein
MTPNPISILDSASLAEAVGVLESRKITGLPVVDAAGTLVGVLSQTDLVRARAISSSPRTGPASRSARS